MIYKCLDASRIFFAGSVGGQTPDTSDQPETQDSVRKQGVVPAKTATAAQTDPTAVAENRQSDSDPTAPVVVGSSDLDKPVQIPLQTQEDSG